MIALLDFAAISSEGPLMEMMANGDGAATQTASDLPSSPQNELKVFNSLSRSKVPFRTKDGSRSVTWYNCGPTVYDSSHLGHARNYLTFDILRRILEDYFDYEVLYVMNVTDVDDKIINRARRNYLLDRYLASAKGPEQVYKDMERAFTAEISKQHKKVVETQEELEHSTFSQQKKELTEKLKQEKLKLNNVFDSKNSVVNKEKHSISLGGTAGVNFLCLGGGSDVLASQLDAELGADVTDHAIFRAHASKYEEEFFEDMASLGIRPPDVVVRVTEYIEQIIEYIQKIVDRKFGYLSNGSVYFDTKAFIDAGHTYGKLNPWAVGSAGLASESEANFDSADKKCGSDFALWKVSKRGEPVWESPWGLGRPGWHIECSAMASDVIGDTIDVHSGGNDLQFPHHDNELAQAEAFHGCSQWVNYFLHSGHLAINGLKMSKSLKNFITIKQALATYSARQWRLLFVIQAWDKPMTFSDTAMEIALTREKKLDTFFDNVQGIMRQSNADEKAKWSQDEKDLNTKLVNAAIHVREHLEDNFDTPGALEVLLHLVRDVNVYCEVKDQSRLPPNAHLVKKVAAYVTKILSVFGLSHAVSGEIGWGCISSGVAGQANREEILSPYLDAIASFREKVRATAMELPSGPSKEKFLALGDSFRDDIMVDIGVRLEDRVPGTTRGLSWKLMDPSVLRRERDEKLQKAKEEKLSKLVRSSELQKKEIIKWEAASKDPKDLFKARTQDFSAFDVDGIPTHDSRGAEITTSSKKKLKKETEKARQQNESLKQKLAMDPNFLEGLKADLKEIEEKISKLRTS